jgi:Arc/MetJ-type ribon-helix-helix transcriptional regulator
MTVELTKEQEQVIDRAIQAGLIRTADDVVGMGVEAIQRSLEERRAPTQANSVEQWLQDFQVWVHSHSITTPLLSDEAINRDSIYGTRGQ